ncbi:hypothetical protein MGWOODY_Mmi2089 [hydrothermal vent metagenome]|uniref:Uncharacterized protein n=1 Tax=hydrothermal vent metagenome TaxID=652676 RepID=A0A160VD43_9ZZZZ
MTVSNQEIANQSLIKYPSIMGTYRIITPAAIQPKGIKDDIINS